MPLGTGTPTVEAEHRPGWVGPYRLVGVLRGVALSGEGVGRGESMSGERVLIRWGNAGPEGGPERTFECLADVASAGVPRPLSLLRIGELAVAVTEWVDGVPLRGADVEVGRVFDDVRSSLERVHAAGWMHGDVKPENIVVGSDGRSWLIDWGGATRLGKRPALGTTGYTASRQQSEGARGSARDDLHALQATIQELVDSNALSKVSRVNESDSTPAAPGEAPHLTHRTGLEVGPSWTSTRGLEGICVSHATSVLSARTGACDALTATVVGLPPGVHQTSIEAVTSDEAIAVARAAMARAAVCTDRSVIEFDSLFGLDTFVSDSASMSWEDSNLDEIRRRISVRVQEFAVHVTGLKRVTIVRIQRTTPSIIDGAWLQLKECLSIGEATMLSVTWHAPLSVTNTMRARHAMEALQYCFPTALARPDVQTEFARQCGVGLRESLKKAVELAAEGRIAISASGLTIEPATEDASDAFACDSNAVGINGCRTCGALGDKAEAAPGARAVLDCAEMLIANGHVSAAISHLEYSESRAQRAMRLDDDVALRIAAGWIDLGDPARALDLLRRRPTQAAELPVLLMHCRAAAAAGDVGELRNAVSYVEAACESPGSETHEVQWSLAAAEAHIGRSARAYKRLRQSLKARSLLTSRQLVTLLSALGNTLRIMGRRPSARRTLSLARVLARSEGMIRLGVSVHVNALLASESEFTEERAAREWEATFDYCRAWRVLSDARPCGVRAARSWLRAGDANAALRCANAVIEDKGNVGTDMWMDAAARIAMCSHDALGHVGPILRGLDAVGSHLGRAQRRMHVRFLESEFGVSRGESDDGASGNSRDRVARLLGIARRLSGAATLSRERCTRIIDGIAPLIMKGEPLLAHVARTVVRGASEGVVRSVCDAAGDWIVTGDEFKMDAAVAFSVLALTWRGCAVSSAHEAVMQEMIVGGKGGRVSGIREWEWSLAMLESGVRRGVYGVDGSVGEQLEEELSVLLSSCGGPVAAAYAGALPWARIADNIGRTPRLSPDAQRACGREQFHPSPSESIGRATLRADQQLSAAVEATIAGLVASARDVRHTSVGSLLMEAARFCLREFSAERAVAVWDHDGEIRAYLADGSGTRELAGGAAELSIGVLSLADRAKEHLLVGDAATDERLGERASIKALRPRSIMATRFEAAGTRFGVLYVENRTAPRTFCALDAAMLDLVATTTAQNLRIHATQEALEGGARELELTRRVGNRNEHLRALGASASEVIHDLNSLFSAIYGEAQYAVNDGEPESLRQSLLQIVKAGEAGVTAITRYQQQIRGGSDVALEGMEIESVVGEAMEFARGAASRRRGEQGPEFRSCIPKGAKIVGAKGAILEILVNLIRNGADAAGNGGCVVVTASVDGEWTHIEVADDGSGMTPEQSKMAFEAFYSTKGDRGNGVGLSACKRLARGAGGEIGIVSGVGVGTRVRLSLPTDGYSPALR